MTQIKCEPEDAFALLSNVPVDVPEGEGALPGASSAAHNIQDLEVHRQLQLASKLAEPHCGSFEP